jgi:MFS family permease
MVRVIAAATTGTAIEWYDFFLYGSMATLIFPKLFFPTSSALIGTILSLLTFLVGFIARPVGGAVFGHLGDRIGRKSTLVATLLLMGISTFVVGLLPTYATLGVSAAIILAVLRFLQGMGVGGEWGGSVLLAMEYGHRRNRGFWASWPQMGVPIGLLLSTVIVNIFSSQSYFATIGWRIPFLISGVLILIGLYIRLRILETPLFAQLQEQGQESANPVGEAFKKSTPQILLSAGARFAEQAPFYLFTVFVITYCVDKLALNKTVVLNGITIAAIIELATIPTFGYLSDRIGRRRWYLAGCALMAIFAFPYFALLNTKNSGVVILGIILSLALCHAWVYGPQAALIAERFGTRTRYSGASLGYQLAAPFAGGLAPIIALLLLNGKTSLAALGLPKTTVSIGAGSWQAVSIYIIVLGLISFFSVLGLAEVTHADISKVTSGVVVPALVTED